MTWKSFLLPFLKKKMMYFLIFYFIFCLFKVASVAYGSSQARGWFGAAAASLCHSHSNTRSEPRLWPTQQVRDWTASSWILVQFLTCWAMMGTPWNIKFNNKKWDGKLNIKTLDLTSHLQETDPRLLRLPGYHVIMSYNYFIVLLYTQKVYV